MTSTQDLEPLRVEVRHHRNRLALLRARIYSGKPTSDARLREFERTLAGAERRLRQARSLPPL